MFVIDLKNDGEWVSARITFDYENLKGKKSFRIVKVLDIHYGTDLKHREPQWILTGYDVDRKELFNFAMSRMTDVMEVRSHDSI